MGTVDLSFFIKSGAFVFVMALLLAACSQPEMIEPPAVAGDVQSSPPSPPIEQDTASQLAQLAADTCRQQREGAETLDLGNKAATSSDIVGFFKSQDCPEILMRQVKKKTGLVVSPKKLSMQIHFEFNSARLTPAGKEALLPVAEALASDELRNRRFVIEGHTDAKGKSAYNLLLSKRRAQSVKHYLVKQFDLDPAHFQAVGKGSSELINASEPYAAENRRVVIALPR